MIRRDLQDLDTGDILLFNRKCMSMSPFGALICVCGKGKFRAEF